MDFESLTGHITQVQNALQEQAVHAVNLSLTARNRLVGCYIVGSGQHGEDRAKYGANLLNKIAKRPDRRGFSERRLYEFRSIYTIYPHIGKAIADFISGNKQMDFLRPATARPLGEPWETPANTLF